MSFKNRNSLKQLFITYPRWVEYETPKELTKFLPPYNYIYIVKEFHDSPDQDTTRNSDIHYHVTIVLKHALTFKKILKWCECNFPDDFERIKIEPLKNLKGALDYSKKESMDYFEDGTVPGVANGKSSSSQKLTDFCNREREAIQRKKLHDAEKIDFLEAEWRKFSSELFGYNWQFINGEWVNV